MTAIQPSNGVTVTVLIPVYNCERFISKAIESILAQSYSDYELLVIDDGSTDNTPDILRKYAHASNRIRLLRHDNKGVGYTLNRGIHEARGALIAELGADDTALPDRLARQVRFLEANPNCVLLGGFLQIIDQQDRAIGLRMYPTDDDSLRRKLPLFNPFGSPSLMYRRADALAAGSYTSRFRSCEDYDFVLRMARLGKIANVPMPLTCYRLHPDATKATRTLLQIRDTVQIRNAAFTEYGYRRTLVSRIVTVLQVVLAHLPPKLSYWLFRRIAIS